MPRMRFDNAGLEGAKVGYSVEHSKRTRRGEKMIWLKIIVVGVFCWLLGYWIETENKNFRKLLDKQSKYMDLQFNLIVDLKARVFLLEQMAGVEIEVEQDKDSNEEKEDK